MAILAQNWLSGDQSVTSPAPSAHQFSESLGQWTEIDFLVVLVSLAVVGVLLLTLILLRQFSSSRRLLGEPNWKAAPRPPADPAGVFDSPEQNWPSPVLPQGSPSRLPGAAGLWDRWLRLNRPDRARRRRTHGRVVGVVIADRDGDEAGAMWLVPLDAVVESWLALDERLQSASLDGERAARGSFALIDLVKAIAEMPTMSSESRRDHVASMLSPQIANSIPRSAEQRFDVLGIVQTCLRYPDGLTRLFEVLRFLEGDSEPLRKAERVAATLLSTRDM
jgi:hypothetical protein